jgi:hypothetical protein
VNAPAAAAATPRGQERDFEKTSWRAALLLAMALHAFWLVKPAPEYSPDRSNRPPPAPVLRYLADAGGPRNGVDEARALMSPAAFSLPTPMGFSPAERKGLEPPLRHPRAYDTLLRRPDGFQLEPHQPARPIPVMAAPAPPIPLAIPVFAAAPAETQAVLRIAWGDALLGLPAQVLPLPTNSFWLDSKPWEAVAWLELDAGGAVRHAFLEKSAGQKDRNAALLRTLYTLTLPADAAGKAGRVFVRFEGGPPAGEAAQP